MDPAWSEAGSEAVKRDVWRDLIWGKRVTLHIGEVDVFNINEWDDIHAICLGYDSSNAAIIPLSDMWMRSSQ